MLPKTRPLLSESVNYQRYDRSRLPVMALAADYDDGYETSRHRHPHAQLVYAVQGVMVVRTDAGLWVVPTTRALWLPAGVEHAVRMIGEVHMRTAYVRPDAAPHLPGQIGVLDVSPLLRELILAAVAIELPYMAESRDGRLMRLLLDEIRQRPVLPLDLPYPGDPRLRGLCQAIMAAPDDPATLADWARRVDVDPKTLQRWFKRETGMTFGRWRQQARLLVALQRLGNGSRVLDVALDLGYNSVSAFTHMFRKQFGVPPSTFFR